MTVKLRGMPIAGISSRKIRTHSECMVEMNTALPCSGSICRIRSFISLAALLVKVIARILFGQT